METNTNTQISKSSRWWYVVFGLMIVIVIILVLDKKKSRNFNTLSDKQNAVIEHLRQNPSGKNIPPEQQSMIIDSMRKESGGDSNISSEQQAEVIQQLRLESGN